MQYFLPFWPADGIHEQFDPWNDTWDGERKRIWEVYDKPPIDGVLVSLENLKRNKKFMKETITNGIHEAIGYHGTIMADCGAFTYKNEEKTPDPIETLENYKKYGFDIGVTVDHLIVNSIDGRELSDKEKYARWQLTLDNAEIMYKKSREKKYEKMRLIGVTQGVDHEHYEIGLKKLFEIGFDYVALGGLVRKPNRYIINVLERIHPIIQREMDKRNKKNKIQTRIGLHLFGIGRVNLLDKMLQYGVTSFDNAYHRKAWTDSKKNYLINGDYYTAIRIRLSDRGYDQELENKIINYLQNINEISFNNEKFLSLLEKYDPITTNLRKDDYLKTLHDKPWELCDCNLCKNLGVHICVLRGNERNMRRGFHNIYKFYDVLRKNIPSVFVFTWCTSKKRKDEILLPAFLRYSASNSFRTFWKNVYDLPIEIGILSAKYGLISWDTLIPNYEQRLTIKEVPNIIYNLKIRLKRYDKIYFIGLGTYKKAIEIVSNELDNQFEIYPKKEYSKGRKLDIIEYNKQMKLFRNDIIKEIFNNDFKC